MEKELYHVIGVMSGTSLDGIDVCNVIFSYNKVWSYKIIKTDTIEYPNFWREKLKNAIYCNSSELEGLDNEYTGYQANIIKEFINKHSISNLDFICNHGHTVFHLPEKGVTKQIGNQASLATILNKLVICDFRVQDVELGGQGAPLVPIGDHLLFGNYESCLNLGGFANISFIENSKRIAFDICPVNIVLNHYVSKLGFDFDDNGEIATTGKVNNDLLNCLNDLKYYSETYPKSLGLEWVLSSVFPLIDSFEISVKDILRTFIEHVAFQISLILKSINLKTVLITGGGAYNGFLIQRIKSLSDIEVTIPEKELIECKEALIFAFLGVLKYRNEVNCLSSVTGAKKDHSSGVIFHP